MSELSDGLAAASSALSDLGTKVTTLGNDLQTEIAEINAKIAAGTVTPEDLANLQTLTAGISAAGASIQGISDQVKAIVP